MAYIVWNDGDANNSNWTTNDNWVSGSAPSASDIAEFAESGSGSSFVDLNTNQSVRGLKFNGNTGDFSINDPSATHTLTLSYDGITTDGDGNIYTISANTLERTTNETWWIGAGDKLVVAGNSTVTSDGGFDNLTIDGTGTVEFLGNVDITSYTVIADGVTIANGGVFDNRGFLTVQGGAEFAITGDVDLQENDSDGFIAVIEDGGLVTLESDSGRVGTWEMEGGELNITNNSVFGDWGGFDRKVIKYVAGSSSGQARITGNGEFDVGRLTRRIEVQSTEDLNEDMEIEVPIVNLDGRDGSLEKDGVGTLNLEGNDTYNNPVNVNAGTLLINGSTSGQGDYTVKDGATLGGAGSIGLSTGNSVIIENGGLIAPGNPYLKVGTLVVNGDFVLNAAEYEWSYGNSSGDKVDVNGDLSLPSTATISVNQSLVGGDMPTTPVLFSFDTRSGANDLSGWTINGLSNYVAKIDDDNKVVYLEKDKLTSPVISVN